MGATLGLAGGTDRIPERWKTPIGEGVFLGNGIRDLKESPPTLSELTRRVHAQIGRLPPKSWRDIDWTNTADQVDLLALPGTIQLHPFGSSSAVPWANGELPAEVKEAGGADWVWEVARTEERQLVSLAREGARLYVDDLLVVDCPAGLPYVPATHRCPGPARVAFTPTAGQRRVRLELVSRQGDQQASVLLAYPDLHLCPWTREEIPHRAVLI